MSAGTTYAGAGPAGADPVGASSPTAVMVQSSNPALWDLATKQCLRDASGLLLRIHWVDQAVALALGIRVGSIASLPEMGHKLRQIKRAIPGQALQNQVEDYVNLALRALVDRQDIFVVRIVASVPVQSQIVIAISYMNLRLPSDSGLAKISIGF